MKNYMLDTNICIYLMNNKSMKLARKFERVGAGRLFISVMTLAELEYGISKSEQVVVNKIALAYLLMPIEILRFDEEDAEVYGALRAGLEKGGNVIGAEDMLIASQALARDMVLVSNNLREFNRIKALKTENWL